MKARKYSPLGGDVATSLKEQHQKDPELGRMVEAQLQRMKLAQKIKKIRESAHLTQEQLAELAGTKQPAIARIETGKAIPTIDLLTRVVSALGARLEIHIYSQKH